MPLLVLLIILLPLAAACGEDESAESPAQLVGVIVAVENDSGGRVESFDLEAEGKVYTVHIAPDVDYGFDLAHLDEHRTTGEPVRCVLEERGERLYALEIVDAPVT